MAKANNNDMSSTFNTISAPQLLTTLSTLGVTSWVVKWLHNDFSTTFQVVCANGKKQDEAYSSH